jgi:carboxylesterase
MPNLAAPFDFPGDRRGVLLLHGFTGTPYEVRPLGEQLARRGMTVVGPVVAGHCTSARSLEATTWHDWEASAAAALDGLRARCDRICVAGLSMGGLLAARLAFLRTQQISGLVMMSVPLWLPAPARRGVRALARLGFPRAVPKVGGSDVRDRAAKNANPAYREFPVRAVNQLVELCEEVQRELSSIVTPTLVLHGRHDHTAPPACAGAISDALGARDVRLVWLEHSYHLLPLDVEKDRVANLVGDFVEEKLS